MAMGNGNIEMCFKQNISYTPSRPPRNNKE